VSKVIRIRFGFALIRYAIGLKDSHHFVIQSEVRPNPIVTRSHTFPRASRQLHEFAWSFDWFNGLSTSFVIGQSDHFGIGFN
jgi:hypothetical protein